MMEKTMIPVELKNSQDWFTCYQLPGDVYAIREEQHWQNVCSFLIIGSRRAVLFDTGLGIRDIKKAAEELYSGEITVVNSHCHFDHIGCNWRFEKVIVPENDYALKTAENGVPADAISDQAVEEAFSKGYPKGFSAEDFYCRPYDVETAKDGDIIDLGNRRLEYMETPGHSQDCIMLYERETGILFSGDMIYLGGLFVQFDDDLYGKSSLDEYIASIGKTAERCPEIKMIYASHNDCIVKPEILSQMARDMELIQQGRVAAVLVEEEGYGYKKGELLRYVFENYSVVVKNEEKFR